MCTANDMLQKLIVNNYAIIDHLSFEPDGKLNIITGETGAGKSIILGALSLILGVRADTSVLINKEEKCVVEAYFDVVGNSLFAELLKEHDVDHDDICIIRREIGKSGRSRAFVNDTPVTLGVLEELTGKLVDLHQQFDHLSLESDYFQLNIIDALSGNNAVLKEYGSIYTTYSSKKHRLAKLKAEQAHSIAEKDYKQFQLSELEEAAFKNNEIEDAEQQLRQLENGERILGVLQYGTSLLEDGEQPLVNELKRLSQQLDSIQTVMEGVPELYNRVESAYIELKDIAQELSAVGDKVLLDEQLIQELRDRVDLGNKLMKKHAVQTTDDLIAIQLRLSDELGKDQQADEEILVLEKDVEELYGNLIVAGNELTASRVGVVDGLCNKMNELLALVGMPNARFKVDITQVKDPSVYGLDAVTFLLDANKSGVLAPIYKAASGGEMSRIMLCLKSLTAKALQLPTLIFDEVDSGISGEAAKQVGVLLRELATYHQVICITHQPQVAGKGTRHFFVFKQDISGKIATQIRVLSDKERVEAIARMIGGDTPSEAAINNAKELIA